MEGILVIIPCGLRKVWDSHPRCGPTPARFAYTGAPFKVNREYAEHFAERWAILSAKYGFIPPEFVIPGPYNVTFKDPSTHPISVEILRKQVREQRLDVLSTVIGLGGKDYRVALTHAFAGTTVNLHFPFAGLALGPGMKAVRAAISRGHWQGTR